MRIMFFNIDTINDFMNEDGALYVPFAEMIKPVLFDITRFAVEKSIPVVNICDSHTENDPELSKTPDFKITFPTHAIKGTKGSFQIKETNQKFVDSRVNLNMCIFKNQLDVFEGKSRKEIEPIINSFKPEFVVVYGVAADFCVDRAVDGLLARGIGVFVVNDATVPINTNDWSRLLFKWVDDGAIIARWRSVRNLIIK